MLLQRFNQLWQKWNQAFGADAIGRIPGDLPRLVAPLVHSAEVVQRMTTCAFLLDGSTAISHSGDDSLWQGQKPREPALSAAQLLEHRVAQTAALMPVGSEWSLLLPPDPPETLFFSWESIHSLPVASCLKRFLHMSLYCILIAWKWEGAWGVLRSRRSERLLRSFPLFEEMLSRKFLTQCAIMFVLAHGSRMRMCSLKYTTVPHYAEPFQRL